MMMGGRRWTSGSVAAVSPALVLFDMPASSDRNRAGGGLEMGLVKGWE